MESTREVLAPDRRRPSPRERPLALITGGAGFVGTNLADRLVREGRRVRVLDNLARRGVERNLRWLRRTHGDASEARVADVRDRAALREAVAGVAEAFHLAAQVAVTTSLDDPVADFEVNATGTVLLLEARFAPIRPGDQRWYVSDTTRLGGLGWRATVGVRDGVETLYRWLSGVRDCVPA